MSIFNLGDGQQHFCKGGLNPGHLLSRAQANSNWLVSVKIGNKTRTLIEWLGKISDVHLSQFCVHSTRTIGRKRNELKISYFTGYARDVNREVSAVRDKRIRGLMHQWAKKRPVGMAEFIQEDSWIKMAKYYG